MLIIPPKFTRHTTNPTQEKKEKLANKWEKTSDPTDPDIGAI